MKSTTAKTCLRIFIIIQAATFVVPSEDAQFWNEQTQALLNKYLQTDYNCGVAKNAILFIGDGMGLPSQFTGRVLKGQLKGKTGEEEFLEWEKWQHTGLAKTYNTDYQVPDSAATATAFLCGVKAKKGTVGLDDTLIDRGDCPSASKAEVSSIAEWAIAAGKSAGLITSARVTHASPAPLYAHSADRKWESDTAGNSECRDIARQLIEDMPGKQSNVVLGGGRSRFTPTTLADIEYPEKFGRRSDFRNLINEWTEEMTKNELQHAYVWNATQFNSIDPADVDYLLGLFEPDELPTVLNKSPAEAGNPTLAEMLRKAIQILQKNPNGYYLFVESSNIDWAHHDGQAYMATQEVLVLDDAVQVAMDMTNPSDTLLVVTADHSHVMTVAGYPKRGNPMFGLVNKLSDVDNMPYTTVLYGAGPGYRSARSPNLTEAESTDPRYVQEAAVPLDSEPHGGEDVAVFANGPMAHLFRGNFEQTFIAHAMAYAMCVGSNKQHCTEKVGICAALTSSSPRQTNAMTYVRVVILIFTSSYIAMLLA